jgi:hypothetical protein
MKPNVGKRSSSADTYTAGNGSVQLSAGKKSRSDARYGSEDQDRATHAAADRGVAGSATELPFFDFIQSSFGRHDVGDVVAHTDPAAQQASSELGARAYAKGNHVAFGTTPDLHTAAHEAAHVVQQRSGVQLKGGVGEAGDYYEGHADAVADRVVRGESAEDLLDQVSSSPRSTSDAVQLLSDGDFEQSFEESRPVDPGPAPEAQGPAEPSAQADPGPALEGPEAAPQVESGEGGWGEPSVEEIGREEVAPPEEDVLDGGAPRPDGSMLNGAQVEGMEEAPADVEAQVGEAGAIDPGAGGGGGGEVSPEMAAFMESAQNEAREAAGQAESEATAFKAKQSELRDQFAEQQNAVVVERVATMTTEEKRTTLIEMGYSAKAIKKMKPAEIDGIITGTYQAEIRRARIQGMDVGEAQALPLGEKRAFLVDLGIDEGDLNKLGPDKVQRLFDDIARLSRIPGNHKVKAKVKGGPFGRSWEVSIRVDGEGNVQEMSAKKEGGWLSKAFGWIKAALPIILVVLAPVTGGLSLVALAAWKAVVAIKNGDWLGLITAVAGAISGGATFLVSRGAAAAAGALSKVADIAMKVSNVARAAQASILAAKAKSPGSLMAALAGGAAAFAGFTENATAGFGASMKKWAEKLDTWAKRISGAESTVRAARSGDPLGALQGAFTTVSTFVPEEKQATWQRAAKVAGHGRTAQRALEGNPPDYATVVDVSMQIADELTASQATEDASRITTQANRLKQAIAANDPAAIAAAALDLANAIAVARYDALTPEGQGGGAGTPTPDQERYRLLNRHERAHMWIGAAGGVLSAARVKPRPDYLGALAGVTDLLSLMTGDKWAEHASRLTGRFAAWTTAVNGRDEMGILNAAEALGNEIMAVRAEMEAEKNAAEAEQAERAGAPGAPADQKTEELWALYDLNFETADWYSYEAPEESGTAMPISPWEQGFDNERQLVVAREIVVEHAVLQPAVESNPVLRERVQAKKGPAKKAPLTADSPPVKAALDKHRQNVTHLHHVLQQGRTQPRTRFGLRWSNACEWLLSGRTQVHALTRTHDSTSRARAQGKGADIAYFGASVAIPNHSDYDFNDPRSSRNINFSGSGVAGWQSGTRIAIMEPGGLSLEALQDFVVHETLHASDGNQPNVQSGYETEFDAYWLSGRFDHAVHYPGSARGAAPPAGLLAAPAPGFDNQRQLAIFSFLATSPVYTYINQAWQNDPAFRTFVVRHRAPRGFNLEASSRVEDFRVQVVARDLNKAWVAYHNLSETDKDGMRAPGARDEWIDLLDAWPTHGLEFIRRLSLWTPMAPNIRAFHSSLMAIPFSYPDSLSAFSMLSPRDLADIRGPLRNQFENLVKRLPEPHDWEYAGKLGFR